MDAVGVAGDRCCPDSSGVCSPCPAAPIPAAPSPACTLGCRCTLDTMRSSSAPPPTAPASAPAASLATAAPDGAGATRTASRSLRLGACRPPSRSTWRTHSARSAAACLLLGSRRSTDSWSCTAPSRSPSWRRAVALRQHRDQQRSAAVGARQRRQAAEEAGSGGSAGEQRRARPHGAAACAAGLGSSAQRSAGGPKGHAHLR